jgi:hypothetical protein
VLSTPTDLACQQPASSCQQLAHTSSVLLVLVLWTLLALAAPTMALWGSLYCQ